MCGDDGECEGGGECVGDCDVCDGDVGDGVCEWGGVWDFWGLIGGVFVFDWFGVVVRGDVLRRVVWVVVVMCVDCWWWDCGIEEDVVWRCGGGGWECGGEIDWWVYVDEKGIRGGEV